MTPLSYCFLAGLVKRADSRIKSEPSQEQHRQFGEPETSIIGQEGISKVLGKLCFIFEFNFYEKHHNIIRLNTYINLVAVFCITMRYLAQYLSTSNKLFKIAVDSYREQVFTFVATEPPDEIEL